VAYRQPITRADVEAVRGVQCGDVLHQLMEKGLVRITGRDDSLGRPMLFGTTKKFLQVFGLRSLRDLPPAAGMPPGGAAEKSGPTGGSP
jgi:segregation and condensation protein B